MSDLSEDDIHPESSATQQHTQSDDKPVESAPREVESGLVDDRTPPFPDPTIDRNLDSGNVGDDDIQEGDKSKGLQIEIPDHSAFLSADNGDDAAASPRTAQGPTEAVFSALGTGGSSGGDLLTPRGRFSRLKTPRFTRATTIPSNMFISSGPREPTERGAALDLFFEQIRRARLFRDLSTLDEVQEHARRERPEMNMAVVMRYVEQQVVSLQEWMGEPELGIAQEAQQHISEDFVAMAAVLYDCIEKFIQQDTSHLKEVAKNLSGAMKSRPNSGRSSKSRISILSMYGNENILNTRFGTLHYENLIKMTPEKLANLFMLRDAARAERMDEQRDMLDNYEDDITNLQSQLDEKNEQLSGLQATIDQMAREKFVKSQEQTLPAEEPSDLGSQQPCQIPSSPGINDDLKMDKPDLLSAAEQELAALSTEAISQSAVAQRRLEIRREVQDCIARLIDVADLSHQFIRQEAQKARRTMSQSSSDTSGNRASVTESSTRTTNRLSTDGSAPPLPAVGQTNLFNELGGSQRSQSTSQTPGIEPPVYSPSEVSPKHISEQQQPKDDGDFGDDDLQLEDDHEVHPDYASLLLYILSRFIENSAPAPAKICSLAEQLVRSANMHIGPASCEPALQQLISSGKNMQAKKPWALTSLQLEKGLPEAIEDFIADLESYLDDFLLVFDRVENLTKASHEWQSKNPVPEAGPRNDDGGQVDSSIQSPYKDHSDTAESHDDGGQVDSSIQDPYKDHSPTVDSHDDGGQGDGSIQSPYKDHSPTVESHDDGHSKRNISARRSTNSSDGSIARRNSASQGSSEQKSIAVFASVSQMDGNQSNLPIYEHPEWLKDHPGGPCQSCIPVLEFPTGLFGDAAAGPGACRCGPGSAAEEDTATSTTGRPKASNRGSIGRSVLFVDPGHQPASDDHIPPAVGGPQDPQRRRQSESDIGPVTRHAAGGGHDCNCNCNCRCRGGGRESTVTREGVQRVAFYTCRNMDGEALEEAHKLVPDEAKPCKRICPVDEELRGSDEQVAEEAWHPDQEGQGNGEGRLENRQPGDEAIMSDITGQPSGEAQPIDEQRPLPPALWRQLLVLFWRLLHWLTWEQLLNMRALCSFIMSLSQYGVDILKHEMASAMLGPDLRRQSVHQLHAPVLPAEAFFSLSLWLMLVWCSVTMVAMDEERRLWLAANARTASYIRGMSFRNPYPWWSPLEVDYSLAAPGWNRISAWLHGAYFRPGLAVLAETYYRGHVPASYRSAMKPMASRIKSAPLVM